MVVQDFAAKTVFLDTAPLIYFIEGHSVYHPILAPLFDFNDKAGFSFVASTITLLEVLVKPIREGKIAIADQYRHILTNAPGIEILDMNTAIAETAARLRAIYNLKTPDSIQLATALEAKADYFLTNDIKLKLVSEVAIVTVDELMQ